MEPQPQRRDNATSSAGLGLGLYVSERIIAAHEGKLSVQSAPQTGTRFEAVIPRQLPGRGGFS